MQLIVTGHLGAASGRAGLTVSGPRGGLVGACRRQVGAACFPSQGGHSCHQVSRACDQVFQDAWKVRSLCCSGGQGCDEDQGRWHMCWEEVLALPAGPAGGGQSEARAEAGSHLCCRSGAWMTSGEEQMPRGRLWCSVRRGDARAGLPQRRGRRGSTSGRPVRGPGSDAEQQQERQGRKREVALGRGAGCSQ